jgi:hypothetical protein
MANTTIEDILKDDVREQWLIGQVQSLRHSGFSETKASQIAVEQWEELKIKVASLQTPSNEKDLVVYDQINGDFIEVASLEDALKYIKEVATDPEEGIHPDIESIKVYKEVADVTLEEVEGEEETYKVKVIPKQSTPIPILTPCVELEKEVERLKGLIEKMYIDHWRHRPSNKPLSETLLQFKTENNL